MSHSHKQTASWRSKRRRPIHPISRRSLCMKIPTRQSRAFVLIRSCSWAIIKCLTYHVSRCEMWSDGCDVQQALQFSRWMNEARVRHVVVVVSPVVVVVVVACPWTQHVSVRRLLPPTGGGRRPGADRQQQLIPRRLSTALDDMRYGQINEVRRVWSIISRRRRRRRRRAGRRP